MAGGTMNRITSTFTIPGLASWAKLAGGLSVLVLLLSALAGAQSTGTVTGTVADQTGAVVTKAKVTLHNDGTGDNRESTSNESGYFSFASVPPGTYTVKVSAPNFKSFERKGLAVRPGDLRNINDIALEVGTSTDIIEVTGVADEIAPTDSGERSAVLTSRQIQNLSLEGRDATELIRTLPGFSVYNGLNNQAQDFTTVSPGSGAVGQGYVGNGAAYRGGSDLTLDGAHILDNGCNCGATTTVNGDMVSEVKVQTSNFGADSAKGPVVVNAIGKSGTQAYHGEVYLYARDAALNSVDWSFKHQMILNNQTNPLKITPPQSRFLYPGVQFGGPVPGTGKKLVFHTAYEYYHQAGLPSGSPQTDPPGLITDTVPTDSMRNGIFDLNPTVAQDNASFCSVGGNAGAAICTGTYNSSATYTPGGNLPGPGVSQLSWVDSSGTLHTGQNTAIPSSAFDLGGSIIMANIPAPNADPSVTGGFNYIAPVSVDQNGWMWRTRADYNLSDNTKIYGTYQVQKETDNVPIHLWWQPFNSIPFPGGMSSKDNSHTVSGHFVKIISPTLTNDFSTGLGYINYPLTRSQKSAWAKSTGGIAGTAYPYANGPFQSNSLMMPDLNAVWSSGIPAMAQPDIFSNGNHFTWQKWNYSLEDSITKSYKTHTVKAGFYYERTVNNQGAFTDYNGNFSPQAGGYTSNPQVLNNCFNGSTLCGSDNLALDLLLGVGGFDQVNISALDNLWYPTYSGYAQDDWKVTKRLTLNLGLRADHLGAWRPPNKFGILGWTGDLNSTIPGFGWHAANPSVPFDGRTVATITWEPRLGMALDLRGNGKTVLRGGWGEYGYRDQWNDYATPADTPQGVLQYNNNFPLQLSFTDFSGNPSFGTTNGVLPSVGCGHLAGGTCGVTTGALLTDHQQPITRNYNFTISQQLPWSSLFEIGYVGAEGRYGLIEGNNQNVDPRNANAVPAGAAYSAVGVNNPALPNGCTPLQATNPNGACNISSVPIALFPLNADYGSNAVYLLHHLQQTNYNALQMSWARQKGRISYNLNYTWSKTLGTQGQGGGAGSGLGPDANNLRHDYGVLGTDRSHVINLSYTFQTGNPVRGAMGYVANGWNISGITTWQSGPYLPQVAANTSLSLGGAGPSYFDPTTGATGADCATIGGGTCGVYSLNNLTYLGTGNSNIEPTVVCNPSANLKTHQYFNANCFSGPTPGINGPWQLPYIHGPAYFNSDLALFKTFKVTERQNVEFRISGFNFLNHPLDSMQNNGDMTLTMNYQCNGASASSTNYCPLGSGQYVVTNASTSPYKLTGSNVSTGYASTRLGRRVLEVSAKYTF
jgi:hypothetical protein